MINGKRNAEAENKSSVRLCQRNRSYSAPSHADQTQPTRSPADACVPAKSDTGSRRKVTAPGPRLSFTRHPGSLLPDPPSAGTLAGRRRKVQAGVWRGEFQTCRGSGPALEPLRRAICLRLSSPGSWGIREMGCCLLSLVLVCRPDQLLGRREKNTVNCQQRRASADGLR